MARNTYDPCECKAHPARDSEYLARALCLPITDHVDRIVLLHLVNLINSGSCVIICDAPFSQRCGVTVKRLGKSIASLKSLGYIVSEDKCECLCSGEQQTRRMCLALKTMGA